MDRPTNEHSPEFQQFLQQVETALLKSSAEARRIAEQTGTKLIIFERESCAVHTGDSTPVRRDGEQHPAG